MQFVLAVVGCGTLNIIVGGVCLAILLKQRQVGCEGGQNKRRLKMEKWIPNLMWGLTWGQK